MLTRVTGMPSLISSRASTPSSRVRSSADSCHSSLASRARSVLLFRMSRSSLRKI